MADTLTEVPPNNSLDARLSVEQLRIMGENISKHGDALDNAKWLKRFPAAGCTALVAAGFVGANVGSLDTFLSAEGLVYSSPYYAVLTAGGIVAAKTAKRINRGRQQRRYDERLEHNYMLQDATGLELEVFRDVKTKILDVRWYAEEAIPAKGLSRALDDIADVAEGLGADSVTVHTELIEDYLDSSKEYPVQTREMWLGKHKSRLLKGRGPIKDVLPGSDELISLTKDDVRGIAERARQGNEREPLDSLMRILKHIEPDHPALQYYKPEAKRDPAVDRRLERSLRRSIERRLQDVDVLVTMDDEDFVRERQKLHLLGRPHVSHDGRPLVDWDTNLGALWHRSDDLLHRMKIDQTGLESLFKNWQNFPPHKIAELCELVSWLSLNGHAPEIPLESITTENGEQVTDTQYASQVGLQERLGLVLFASRKQIKQLDDDPGIKIGEIRTFTMSFRSSMAIGAVALLAAIGAGRIENYFYSRDNYDPAAYPAGKGLYDAIARPLIFDPNKRFEEVEQRVLESLGISSPPKDFTNVRPGLRDSQSFSGLPDRSAVGDVDVNSPNEVLWNIHRYGGMDAQGLWVDDVLDRVSNGNGHGVDNTLYWFNREDEPLPTVEDVKLGTPDNLDLTKPLMGVEGVIDFDNIYRLEHCTPQPKEYCAVLNLPVLEGTKIVGMRIEGAQNVFRRVTLASGQQLIYIEPTILRGERRVEYWLAPAEQAQVHAVRPTEIVALDISSAESFEEQEAKARAVITRAAAAEFQQLLGGTLPDDPVARIDAEAAAMAAFRYELAPFGDRPPADFIEYIQKVLRLRAGNCNVVNTVLGLSNPDQLNAVIGFDNSDGDDLPPGESILTSHEAHFETVDKQGELHDATPALAPGSPESSFFKEKYESPQTAQEKKREKGELALKYMLGVSAVLGIAGVYASRKKIAKGALVLRRASDQLYVASVRGQRLELSHDSLNHALWADDATEFRASRKAQPREQILDSLADYERSGLRQSFPGITGSRSYRRALRRAKRLMRATHQPAKES